MVLSSSIEVCLVDRPCTACAPILPDWMRDSTTTSVVERVTGESMDEPEPWTAVAALAVRGFVLPDPGVVDAFWLSVWLDDLVAALRDLGIELAHAHHLSDATLYARLHLRLTVERLRLPARGRTVTLDLLDLTKSAEVRAYDELAEAW